MLGGSPAQSGPGLGGRYSPGSGPGTSRSICYAEFCEEEGSCLPWLQLSRLPNKRASHCVTIGPIAVCASVSSSVKWEESI